MSIQQFSPFISHMQGPAFAPMELESVQSQKLIKILSSYREFRRFNISSLLNARLFIIAEEHRDPQSIAMKASLVNFLASQGPVLLLHEGLPSGELLIDYEQNKMKKDFVRAYFDSIHEDSICIAGWDGTEECIKKASNPLEHLNTLLQVAEENYNQGKRELNTAQQDDTRERLTLESVVSRMDKLIDKIDRRNALFAQGSQIAPGIFEHPALVMNLNDSDRELIMKQILPEIVKLSESDLEKELSLCENAQKESMQKIMELNNQITQAHSKLIELMAEVNLAQMIVQKFSHNLPVLKQHAIRETNPERNTAAISTLQNLSDIKNRLDLPSDVPVVMIMGVKHCKVDEEDLNDFNYDLTPLYEELERSHKAVILIPPHIWD